jgi:hypothetical protein
LVQGVEASGASHASTKDSLPPLAFRLPPSCSSFSFHLLSFRGEGSSEATREAVYLTRGVRLCLLGGEGAKSGTPPPRYSPKYQNEPEKYFRISKNAQKRTRERTRTNPSEPWSESPKSFRIDKASRVGDKGNGKRTRNEPEARVAGSRQIGDPIVPNEAGMLLILQPLLFLEFRESRNVVDK